MIVLAIAVVTFLFARMCSLTAYAVADYFIYTNTNYLSFGNLSKGDQTDYQEIIVYNPTETEVNLIWYTSDPDNILYVDAPNDSIINPYGSTTFYVKAKTDVGEGTHRASIYMADSSDPSYTFGECVNVSMTIREEKPYVTSVSVTPGNISATKNSSVRFNANVSGGNNYNSGVDWSISGQNGNSSIDSNGTLSIGSNESSSSITVKAVSKQDSSVYGTATVSITKDTYTISTSASPSNGGAVSGGGTVDKNGNVTLSASPYTGYQFVRWTQNGREVSTSTRYTVNNVTESMSFVAEFKQVNCKIHITSNHSYGGNITGDTTVPYGSDLTITATANPGYKFDGWYENNSKVSDNASYKITSIKSDHTYTAMFNPNKYTVAASASPTGSGTITGTGSFNQGDNVVLTAKAANGYTFTGWFLNGTEYSKNSQITVSNINKDYSFVAYFTKNGVTTFNITSSTDSNNGTISPEGNYLVPQGTSVNYAITPKAGYVIADVKVDNVSIGAVNSYTFTNVSSAHSIVASFKAAPAKQQDTHNTATNNTSSNMNTTTTTNTATTTTTTTNANTNTNTDAAAANKTNSKVDNSEDWVRPAEDYNIDYETGILQKYNMSDEQAINLIRNGGGHEMFEEALHDGTFQINIYNEMGNEIGAVYSIFEFDKSEVSLPNLADALGGMLNDQDLMDILHSKNVAISFNVFNNTATIDENEKRYLQTALFGGMTIGEYFDITILKTVDGETTKITELSKPMTVRITVPASLRQEGRSFYIIRSHTDSDGIVTADILTDIDPDPDKIAFETDRFSSYAIAYTMPLASGNPDAEAPVNPKKDNKTSGIIVLGAVVGGFVLSMVCVNAVIASSKKKKK